MSDRRQDRYVCENVRPAVHHVIDALASGGVVVVAHGADDENGGDLVMAAATITPEKIAFFLRHGSGIISVPMTDERADELDLLPMVAHSADPKGTAFTVSVDHVGTATGISAVERSLTVRALADPRTRRDSLRRPGHVFPVRTRPGGVLTRGGRSEAAVDLVRLADRGQVAVLTELLGEDGESMSSQAAEAFATRHRIPLLTMAELVRYRRSSERLVRGSGKALLPTRFGVFTATAYQSLLDGSEHLALACGDLTAADNGGVLAQLHVECVTGDALRSQRCDCGTQLADALARISREGVGVLVYLREGTRDGLTSPLLNSCLRQRNSDPLGVETTRGLPTDREADYGIGAQILTDLGVHRLRLITDDPQIRDNLRAFGFEIVERVPKPPTQTGDHLAGADHQCSDNLSNLPHASPSAATPPTST